MAEIAPPLFDREPQRATSGSRRKMLGVYIVEAFRFSKREYIGKKLYARLTGILFAALVLLAAGVILAFTVGEHEVKRNSNTLTGLGIAVTVIVVVIVVWITIRQLSLVASRFRAAGLSFGAWSATHFQLWLLAGLAIPIVAIHALSLKDSEFYRRLDEALQTMPKPGQPQQSTGSS